MDFNSKNYIHFDYYTIGNFKTMVDKAIENLEKCTELLYEDWCIRRVQHMNDFKWWQIKRVPTTVEEFKIKNSYLSYKSDSYGSYRHFKCLNELKDSFASEPDQAYSFTLATYKYIKQLAEFDKFDAYWEIQWINLP